MIGPPPPTHDRRVYRASRARRRRRARGLTTVLVVLVVLAAVAAGAWALGAGPFAEHAGDSGGVQTGADSSGTDAGTGSSASPGADVAISPTPSPTPTPPKVIEIGWIGDTTPGSQYGLPPNGGKALFTATRAKLKQPDLMIANLEGTYSSGGPSKSDGNTSGTSFSFQAPPSYAKALDWAGVDLVSVANNHAFDYFERGLGQTKAALTRVGVEYTGLPKQVTMVEVDGVKVAVLAFSPYPWNANVNDIPAARKLVKKAAAKADVVVVVMHVGAEGADKIHTPRGTEYAFGENRGDPRAFAHAVVDSGADLVFGSGPHVIRGIERYKDRLIAYSLGNFGGWGNFGTGGNLSLSGLLTVRIDENAKIRGGRWISLYIGGSGAPSVDSSNAAAHLVKQLSAADFAKTYRLSANGSFTAD
jgi:hypothetical protein